MVMYKIIELDIGYTIVKRKYLFFWTKATFKTWENRSDCEKQFNKYFKNKELLWN